MENKHLIYLSLGSNLENKKEHLENAVKAIHSEIGRVLNVSSIYKTPAQGFDGEDFNNICIKLETELTPLDLIDKLLSLELDLGRIRTDNKNYQNRVIDIDIILYDSIIMNTSKLTLPHPRALERDFVLFPLLEISGDIIFPNTNKTLSSYTEQVTPPYILTNSSIKY
jgi:2-amino-4-hydroxy-6-hydroxymethyldihydropteridine diphosphokinase